MDEEVYAWHGRYGVDYPVSEYFERERPVVEELRHRLVELVESGRDVVEVLGQRLADRNRRADADALTVTASALEDFIARFEEPAGEGEEPVQA